MSGVLWNENCTLWDVGCNTCFSCSTDTISINCCCSSTLFGGTGGVNHSMQWLPSNAGLQTAAVCHISCQHAEQACSCSSWPIAVKVSSPCHCNAGATLLQHAIDTLASHFPWCPWCQHGEFIVCSNSIGLLCTPSWMLQLRPLSGRNCGDSTKKKTVPIPWCRLLEAELMWVLLNSTCVKHQLLEALNPDGSLRKQAAASSMLSPTNADHETQSLQELQTVWWHGCAWLLCDCCAGSCFQQHLQKNSVACHGCSHVTQMFLWMQCTFCLAQCCHLGLHNAASLLLLLSDEVSLDTKQPTHLAEQCTKKLSQFKPAHAPFQCG